MDDAHTAVPPSRRYPLTKEELTEHASKQDYVGEGVRDERGRM